MKNTLLVLFSLIFIVSYAQIDIDPGTDISTFMTAGEGDLYKDSNDVIYIGLQDGRLKEIGNITAVGTSNGDILVWNAATSKWEASVNSGSGIDIANLPEDSFPDYYVGIKNGQLVKIPNSSIPTPTPIVGRLRKNGSLNTNVSNGQATLRYMPFQVNVEQTGNIQTNNSSSSGAGSFNILETGIYTITYSFNTRFVAFTNNEVGSVEYQVLVNNDLTNPIATKIIKSWWAI